MPVSPGDAEDLGEAATELFVSTERSLFKRIASFLMMGFGGDPEQWAEDRAANTGGFRRLVTSIVGRMRGRARQAVTNASNEAVRRGVAQADEDLANRPGARTTLPDLPTANRTARLTADRLMDKLDPVGTRMIDTSVDRYRKVIVEVSNQVEAGELTRRKAAQAALNRFADLGITSFVDSANRKWEMASYVEMAIRTETARAMVDAHVDRLTQAGVNLVIVSDAPYECPLCKPWERKILAVGRNAIEGKHTVKVDGHEVEVAGSLDEARSKGLFHPNCRHNVSAFMPGISEIPPPAEKGKATYKQTQEQRYLERQARKWDRRRAVAVDDEAKKQAEAKFKEYRARIRDHVKKTGLKRKTSRETFEGAR